MYKIALLTYPFLIPYFEKAIVSFRSQHHIDIIPFEKQHLLLTLIPALIDQYDGICVFSALAGKFITQANPGITKPIKYLDRHSVDYFKTFFMMLNDNREIDFSRVLIDTSMIHADGARTLNDLVKDIALFEDNLIRYTSELSLEDFINMEGQIENNARALWQSGAYDVIVCRFASMAEVMDHEGIPYVFVYPEKHRIEDGMNDLINHIRLDKQAEGLPASIMIVAENDNRREIQEVSQESIRMQKALLEFSKNHASSFAIQFMAKGFEILTSSLTIKKITDNFTCCQLGYYLFSTLGTNVRIAYGIGHDVNTARQNAMLAVKASANTGASCVVNGDGKVVPLQVKPTDMETGEESNKASNLAVKTGLSTVTIQRIRSAMQFLGTNDITNQGLAEVLQVTVANANRFLNALLDSGHAEIVDTKKSLSKGRPSRIYRISL
ncbi:MAG: hypothetical protein FWF83_06070 [Clostridiales bacterium]|nr:hypothetical protein [Clostridiales bacterium]